MLTVNSGLDRETKAQFALTVVAKDSGSPSLSASVVVTVIIDDVNDNPPMFSQSIFYGSIREDASTGSTVLKVSTPLFFLSFFIFDFFLVVFLVSYSAMLLFIFMLLHANFTTVVAS